jgi:peptidoglycan/xylan/chitin deacetylase (PgdA/CDA1 family)
VSGADRLAVLGAGALLAVTGAVIAAPTSALAGSVPSTKACPTPASSVLKSTPARYSRTVALTFDDGPGPHTPAILDALKREGVRATFFVTGAHVKAYPATARRIVAEGHILANHTYTHPQKIAGSKPYGRFSELPKATQASQMDSATKAVIAATRTRPCFFRAPGGWHFSPTTLGLSRARGMSVAHWTVDTEDWRQPARLSKYWQDRIYSRATKPTYAHPIILMHDSKGLSVDSATSYRKNTAVAVTRIARFYKSRGYVFTDPAGRRL